MASNRSMWKEEILGLQWDQVDPMEGKIRLRSEDTKTKEPRVIYLKRELLEVINFQRALGIRKSPNAPGGFSEKRESGSRISGGHGIALVLRLDYARS